MKNAFGRRPAALPIDATQTWDADAGALVVHLPVDTSQPESHDGADTLSDRVLQVVDAINAGNVGDGVIPEDAEAPTARVRVEPTHRSFGELEMTTLQDFQTRLGKSIPLEVLEGADLSEDGEEAEAAEEIVEPVDIKPVSFQWDEEHELLAATVDVPVTTSDATSRRALKDAMDAVFTALRDAHHRGQAPEGSPARYLVTISFAPGAIVGDVTVELQEQIDAQLEGTALTVDVVAD